MSQTLCFPPRSLNHEKMPSRGGKNHRQSSYDATTLRGGAVFESWAEGTRTPGNEIPWMRRIWESSGTLRPQIKAWQMTQQRDQHPSCPLTKPFTQMFCIWRFWGFYEKSNELSWSAQRCQRLETRMFSTSSFPPLEDRKLEEPHQGQGRGISCLNATACFSKYLKEPGNKSLN